MTGTIWECYMDCGLMDFNGFLMDFNGFLMDFNGF